MGDAAVEKTESKTQNSTANDSNENGNIIDGNSPGGAEATFITEECILDPSPSHNHNANPTQNTGTAIDTASLLSNQSK